MSADTREPRSPALDVRLLPSYGFSHRALTWWGTMGVVAIEGTVFALALMAYFYLRAHANTWPLGVKPPELLWGTLNTVVLLASLWPNHMAKKAADAHDARGVKLWLSVCLAFGIAFLLLRIAEFASLNVRWDSNAYGSIVWMLMALHTLHLLTDVADSAVLDALFFSEPVEGRRFVDASENAMYWYFVVWAWLPIYFTVYWGGRAP